MSIKLEELKALKIASDNLTASKIHLSANIGTDGLALDFTIDDNTLMPYLAKELKTRIQAIGKAAIINGIKSAVDNELRAEAENLKQLYEDKLPELDQIIAG